jgi:hypothetical protein
MTLNFMNLLVLHPEGPVKDFAYFSFGWRVESIKFHGFLNCDRAGQGIFTFHEIINGGHNLIKFMVDMLLFGQ